MAAIDDLIAQIEDKALRERLRIEAGRITKEKKFGLVFEHHLPEMAPIYSASVQVHSQVALRDGPLTDLWRVLSVRDGEGFCRNISSGETKQIAIDNLVIVRRFGEPIFPALVPVDKVQNGPDNAPRHTLIEADNYHALQLLEYLYSGQVDCIYIDPPFNSGARDWKYNNDYVDDNDEWRHSKWLAFMNRRLRIAKKLLNPADSTLIVAIDDNELFTLGLLLDEIFKGNDRQIIDITINPKGKARDGRLSQVDEYLIVVYIGEAKAQEFSVEYSDVEVRWPYLRRSDVESARGTKKGGVRQFYPIYVDARTDKIVKIGEALTPAQPLTSSPNVYGAVPVFPIREDGKHMNWGLTGPSLKRAVDLGFVRVLKSRNEHQAYNFTCLTVPSIKKVEDGVYRVTGVREDGSKIVVIPGGKAQRSSTTWKKNLHDANAYGSQMLGTFLKDVKFPFPKSVYSVFDTLKLFIGNKPNALFVDFFAGSGTTLHALNLLNATDGGQRHCILVTNNEVSEEEAKSLRARGLQPGNTEWEDLGICRSVTWPRSKFSILGKRNDGAELNTEYFTGKAIVKEKPRKFQQIGFVSFEEPVTATKKKQLIALIDQMPQTEVKKDSAFIVSEKHHSSILFDDSQAVAWLEALENEEHITNFYIVTASKAVFDALKAGINEMLGPMVVAEEEKRLMREGFPVNLEYFRLDFLEKDRVALRCQFREILPLLWLRAGAIGPRPELAKNKPIPAMLLPEHNPFAVLLDETRFANFLTALQAKENVSHVFLVTNSEEAYQEMASQISVPNVVQLYRDYVENFAINKGDGTE